MGVAAAQDGGHGLLNLGLGSARIFVQEGLGGHDDGVQAEAALGGLFFDEGFLQGMWFFERADAGQGDDFILRGQADRSDAGTNGLSVHDDGAGAALAEAAAEFGAVEFEVIAQDVEERSGRVHVHGVGAAVDFKIEVGHDGGRVCRTKVRVKPGERAR